MVRQGRLLGRADIFIVAEAESQKATDPLIGVLVTGRYRVQARIGEGGMGTVYVAEHEAIEKKIALKVLHQEYSANPEVVERFKQEAISASRIKHPNVIDVFDFGQLDDGSCFIAMELLEGQDLGEVLGKGKALSPQRALRMTLQIARALGLAHSRGVVHRDMKPENVFLQRTPEDEEIVKIVDFGIAQLRRADEAEQQETRQRRLTKTGMIFGTPEYMAPEQARGQAVDQRTDIYAAGIILYELLSGAVPFVGESFLDVLNQHVLDPVPSLRQQKPDLEISAELNAVVEKALAKSPDDRFPTMKDFAQALMKTPEGQLMRSHLTSGGASAEDLVDEMVSSQGPSRQVSGDAAHLSQTLAGAPQAEEKDTAILGSRERTPGTHELSPAELPKKSPLPLWFVAITAIIVAVAGLLWTQLRASRAPVDKELAELESEPEKGVDAQEVKSPADAIETQQRESTEAERAAKEEPESSTETEQENAETVTLSVETVPAGAIVEKGGFQVCDESPCEVIVDRREAVTLAARKGRLRGTAKVLAQEDQTVNMTLRAPRPKRNSRPEPSDKSEDEKPQLCEVMVNGLKIARPCE